MPRTENPTTPHLLTPLEAAQFLRWKLSTIYTAASRRKIPSVKIGKSLRFRRSDLEKMEKVGYRAARLPINGQLNGDTER